MSDTQSIVEIRRGFLFKTAGYLVSTLSVALLGAASWSGLEDEPVLRMVLAAGMLASVAGMALRWLSYCAEHQRRLEAMGMSRAKSDPIESDFAQTPLKLEHFLRRTGPLRRKML